ncbi:MAG: sensor domain-containing phosphodiesterase [Pseudomonadota bacterium]
MPAAPLPWNEADRLAALRALCLLDTPADPTFDRITAIAAAVFNVPVVVVSLIDQRRQWFKSRFGVDIAETPREVAFCSYTILGPDLVVALDTRTDNRFFDNPLVTGPPSVRFYAGIPLCMGDGLNVGTLCLIGTEPREAFSDKERDILANLGAMVTNRLEALHTFGYVDPTTLLPNRSRFLEDTGLWIADPGREPAEVVAAAVDCCGADFFADMARALGRDHAEDYVVRAKERLQAHLPPHLTAYRVDVTRFAFLVDEALVQDTDAAGRGALTEALFEKIVDGFDAPIEHQGIPYNARATIGAFRLSRGVDPAEVFRSLAVITDAVRQHGGKWSFYNSGSDQRQKRAFQLLSALPRALKAGDQLSLHYQPQIDLKTGHCVGAEALLRWRHPDMGAISPAEFIPLSEKTALIGRVTQWVLSQALGQAAVWQRAGHTFKVAINVSAVDLEQDHFVDSLCQLLDQHRVNATGIELEFTESALTIDPTRLTERLQRIRGLGLQLAIDDFGTGYSNLSYLKQVPATTLKIDQSFIRSVMTDARDCAIVPAMIRLAHDLGHRVLAEGIETQDVLDRVAGWGCDEGQGYLIARPLPLDAFNAWLEKTAAHSAA